MSCTAAGGSVVLGITNGRRKGHEGIRMPFGAQPLFAELDKHNLPKTLAAETASARSPKGHLRMSTGDQTASLLRSALNNESVVKTLVSHREEDLSDILEGVLVNRVTTLWAQQPTPDEIKKQLEYTR